MNTVIRSVATIALGFAACATLSACSSAPKTSDASPASTPAAAGASGSGGLKQAVENYNAQHYDQAQQQATDVIAKAPAGQREDAAYVAGLSAYQLGRTNDADRQFNAAVGSSNPQTAANAKAMLGQVRMDQHRWREAATLLSDAAPALAGEDAKKCAANAAIAFQQAGDPASAKKWQLIATGRAVATNDAPPKPSPVTPAFSSTPQQSSSSPAPSPPTAGGTNNGFTLQVGAFKERKRAQKAADEAQAIAKRDGLEQPRIVPRHDERGNPMFVVQMGWFSTRDAAAAARAKIGKLEYIVATAGDSG